MGVNGLSPGRLHSSKEPSSRSQMCTYVKLFCFPCVCSDTPTHNGFPLPVRQKNGKKSHYLRMFGLQLISGFFFYHTQMPSSFISTELCHLKHAPKQLRGARLPWTIFPQPSFGTLCCRRKIQVSISRKFRICYLYEQEFICKLSNLYSFNSSNHCAANGTRCHHTHCALFQQKSECRTKSIPVLLQGFLSNVSDM